MRRVTKGLGPALFGVPLLAVATALTAQTAPSLADRVRSAPAGDVRLDVPLREGIEVCERGIIRADGGSVRTRSWGGGDGVCSTGSATLVLERDASGEVVAIELEPHADLARGTPPARRLGGVQGPAVAAFLFAWVRTGDGSLRRPGEALMVSTVLDGVDPAPDLLELAGDRALSAEVRKSALFWVSQVASARVGPHLQGIASEEAEDQDIRDAAVFALSQRPDAEAVPALMQLARDAPHAKTRRSALFWLAQSDDPRVPGLFEELILRGPLGG